MPEFSVVKESEVPKRPAGATQSAKRKAEYETYVGSLRRGQVGKLVPGPGETPRGVAVRAARAAKRLGKSAETWTVDGVVYFSVT